MSLRALTRSWDLKLLSIGLACALWLFVSGAGRSQVALAAPVEYVGLADHVVLTADPRERVEVELQVSRWVLTRLTAGAVRVRVNLARVPEGESVVAISPADVQAPSGATVLRVTPSRLRVAVARAAEATLRVEPRLAGTPAPGYAVGRVVVAPETIPVRGPRSTIETRTTVETTPLNLTGTRSNVEATVGLALPDFVYPTRERSVKVTVEIRADHTGRAGREGAQR